MRVSARKLRTEARERARAILAELEQRPLSMFPPPVLVKMFAELADFGGLPPSSKAWEAAMTALASPHINDETRNRLLDLLEGRAQRKLETT
jgi:hypothetical protein